MVGDLVRLLHRGTDVRDFSLGAARILGRVIPFDGVCVLTMDPATLLPTGEVVDNGLPPATTPRMTEIELGGKDYNTFAALARSSERRAAGLSAATGGDLDRSARHRELRRPNGFGDELRAALVCDGATWGGLTLLRGDDRGPFTPADVAVLAGASRHLAEGVRRALLLTELRADPRASEQPDAGLVLLAPDHTIASANGAAERWLAELRSSGERLPPVVTGVASRARAIAASGDTPTDRTVARARVRTASGVWLLVRGTLLGDGDGDGADAPAAVILEPARPHELAPLIADAYGLTERERAVTQLVAQGAPTTAIATRLHISPWTVQDHLKAIFEKTGVNSRGELIARVFFARDAPRLSD
jgi:DNA-binding CsgD family transcriptional regulator